MTMHFHQLILLIKMKFSNYSQSVLTKIIDLVDNNYILYHDSINSYCINERSTKRHLLGYGFYWLVCIYINLVLLVLVIYPDENTMRLVGNYFLLPLKFRRFAFVIFYFESFVVLISKVTLLFPKIKEICMLSNFLNFGPIHQDHMG